MKDNRPAFKVRSDSEGVLWLSGELDMAEMDSFIRTATANVDGQREVVLDLSELTFLDSSGLRAILKFSSLVCDKGVVLRNPRENVREVLWIANVDGQSAVRVESEP